MVPAPDLLERDFTATAPDLRWVVSAHQPGDPMPADPVTTATELAPHPRCP